VIARNVIKELGSGGAPMLPSRDTMHPAYQDWEAGSDPWVAPDFR
jgi:hypothetical protein